MNTNSRRVFGSGLDAVLNVIDKNIESDDAYPKDARTLKQIMVHKIVPGKFQPRRTFDQLSLQELSESISTQGILQPIVARQSGPEEYEIVAGERRWRAAQMAGMQQVPVIICELTDKSALAFGLIENIQRQDLNPIEEASALKRLIEEFKMTHEQIAQSIGRSRTMVTNTLRLLNLAEPVQTLLIEKKIDAGHAKVLLIFTPEEQTDMAAIIVQKKLSVRAAEKLAQSKKGKKADTINSYKQVHPKCEEWSRALTEKLSTKVSVNLNTEGSGKVTIHVDSEVEVEWLLKNL